MEKLFNMASVIVLILFVTIFHQSQGEHYTTRWDDINVDEILSSERLLKNYKKCLMDQGSCTAQGNELKKTLPDALKSDCQRCTPKQKEKTKKIVDYILEKKPDWWAELEEKYDPSGVYHKRKMAYLKKKSEKEKLSNIDS